MSHRLRARIVLATAALLPVDLGCTASDHATPPPPVAPPPAASSDAAVPSGTASDSGAPEGDGGYAGPYIGATVLQAPVMSEMEWPGNHRNDKADRSEAKVTRIGTLRYGEKTPVIAEAHKKPNCPEGWYELVAGGFVCGKYATLDLDHPKIKEVKPPDLEGPVPYLYGINVANGTPLYRHVPSHDERTKFEPWLFKPRKAKTDDNNPYAASAIPDASTPDAQGIGEDASDADIPWWEKQTPDGGPPEISLDGTKVVEGPVEQRMVKGFFLSLDHQFPASGSTWWKTVAGKVAPSERILVTKPVSEFHGVWLGQDSGSYATKNVASRKIDKLPVAFVTWYFAKRYTLDDKHKHATVAPGAIDRFDAVGLTGQSAVAEGYEYWETDEGWWIRASSATKTDPGPAPREIGEHEKWIDVNLKRQTLVAYEGQTPVFVTLFSSGRNEHETTPGIFHIREKHISSTMDADTAADGPYSIEDVPYIEYFNAGYAFHSAFWHSEFGHVKSHGCVNLAPWDAKALFGWTEPQLPDGWHAIFASKDKPGTRVIVHERADGTCTGPEAAPPQCPDGPVSHP
jgi:hypothetical protein